MPMPMITFLNTPRRFLDLAREGNTSEIAEIGLIGHLWWHCVVRSVRVSNSVWAARVYEPGSG